MQVKRFVAADMRRALELVREKLGPEAVILSSSRTSRGVEILTTLEPPARMDTSQPRRDFNDDADLPMASDCAWQAQVGVDRAVSRQQAAPAPNRSREPANPPPGQARGFTSGKTSAQLAAEIEQARSRMLAARDKRVQRGEFRPGPRAPADSEQLRELKSELADMRQLLEEQLGRLAHHQGQNRHHTPRQATLWRRFSDMGLPPECIDSLIEVRPNTVENGRNLSDAWRHCLALLARRLPVAGRDLVDEGGIFAFVGPTGVGKTTTIGKLAARYVLKHGSDQVALITTDTYRIAAHDQLRSLGRILNVPVRVVDDNHSLPRVLNSLRHCSLVLIDTAGFRHGDPILKEQLNVLRRHRQVKNFMVLSCNSQLQMMKASMHAYKTAGLSGCVLTKLDETASLGETLGLVLEHRLPVAYTANGQDIPRDLDLCRAHNLVSTAVKLMKANLAANPGPVVNRSPEQRLAAALGRDSTGVVPPRA